MKTVGISEAKAGLSALVRLVRRGETIVILQRGEPVAYLVPPVPASSADDQARIARLVRAGVLSPPRKHFDMKEFLRKHPPVKLRPGTSVVDLLLQEREEGP